MTETEQEINNLNERIEHLNLLLDELIDLLSTDGVMPQDVQQVLRNIQKKI